MYTVKNIKDEEGLAMIRNGWKVCKICGVLFKKIDESKCNRDEADFCGRLCYRKYMLLRGVIITDDEQLPPKVISYINTDNNEDDFNNSIEEIISHDRLPKSNGELKEDKMWCRFCGFKTNNEEAWHEHPKNCPVLLRNRTVVSMK